VGNQRRRSCGEKWTFARLVLVVIVLVPGSIGCEDVRRSLFTKFDSEYEEQRAAEVQMANKRELTKILSSASVIYMYSRENKPGGFFVDGWFDVNSTGKFKFRRDFGSTSVVMELHISPSEVTELLDKLVALRVFALPNNEGGTYSGPPYVSLNVRIGLQDVRHRIANSAERIPEPIHELLMSFFDKATSGLPDEVRGIKAPAGTGTVQKAFNRL